MPVVSITANEIKSYENQPTPIVVVKGRVTVNLKCETMIGSFPENVLPIENKQQ